jgi:SSS family solute:Na+ symporter
MIFAIVLTACFLFGVMLVGMGGKVLYPVKDAEGYRVLMTEPAADGQAATTRIEHVPHERIKEGTLLPHPVVGENSRDFDQVLVVVLKRHAPQLLGAMGPFVVCLVLVAILAASMSTADSNLHALSAVLTRDVYGRFVRPRSSQRERTWFGRLTILGATMVALLLIWVINEHGNDFPIFAAIAKMGLLAIAFTSQLIPLSIDILFVRRGTRAGAVAGMIVGIAIVALFTPFFEMFTAKVGGAGATFQQQINSLRGVIDIGAWGVIGNVIAFVLVSLVTKRPDEQRVAEYERVMRGR